MQPRDIVDFGFRRIQLWARLGESERLAWVVQLGWGRCSMKRFLAQNSKACSKSTWLWQSCWGESCRSWNTPLVQDNDNLLLQDPQENWNLARQPQYTQVDTYINWHCCILFANVENIQRLYFVNMMDPFRSSRTWAFNCGLGGGRQNLGGSKIDENITNRFVLEWRYLRTKSWHLHHMRKNFYLRYLPTQCDRKWTSFCCSYCWALRG